MAKGDEPPQRTQPLNFVVYGLVREMIANDFAYGLHSWLALRKDMGYSVPSLSEPKVQKALNDLERVMALPAPQTIQGDSGEGKLVKAG
jgi:hypothetical protein